MNTILRKLFLALPLIALTALIGCATDSGSSGSSQAGVTGDALRITWLDYDSGQMCEIVSQTHTDMVAKYSEKAHSAGTKVVPDEVVQAVIDRLEYLGYDDVAQEGRAPKSGQGRLRKAFEIETPGGITHFATLKGQYAVAKDLELMNALFTDFFGAYNLIPAYQAVDNPLGGALFDEPLKVQR